MIERFDTYVLTDKGFIATAGHWVFHCYNRGMSKDTYLCAVYRNKQTHKRAVACAAGGTIRWCREAVISMMDEGGYLRRLDAQASN